jgi:class 3 adenylate cyclase/tetratricopeptide (TPR) repeat protein
VTVVFADLVGSTALEEQMDPESVRAVMQRYYALAREVVEARGGRVVKFIGDGAMAVFGVPETREDDALRALDAALAWQEALAVLAGEMERDRGAAISLRVGVNTGEVVVGADDDDVVGDAVNVAARLERAARPGAVVVGEATWRLTRGEVEFEEVQELHVAGKAEKVRARTLVGLQPDRPEVHADFVGRTGEIEVLRAEFDEVVRTESPRLVTVVGSPGVGKTRLGAELERLVASEAEILLAACTRETTVPLAPVAEALRSVCSDEQGSATGRLDGLFGDGDSEQERVTRTLTAIIETGAGATPEETLWALRRLMEALARTRPVVFIVDDLQWAETMMLDLVEHLTEWTRGPLLIVALARPELRDRRAALADSGRHRLLRLEGLGREETARLACQLLGADALPVELLDRLPASTGGNPLFVRELLRMLVDDAVLGADGSGRWMLRVAPEAIDVPPTIQSLLAARLDRLSVGEQAVLERASISGTEFPLGALVELLPTGRRHEASVVIEQLRRKELLESAGSYWIDEPVYRFHHVLIRDAAYRRLLREERAVLHETLAAWIETKTAAVPGEYYELVGHHLEQAYLQRQELGALDEHTVGVGRAASQRLGAAAQRALDRDDPAAGRLAGRALDCLPVGDPARAELLLVRCEALLSAADAVPARDAVAELERLAASSRRVRAWAACFAAQLATLTDPAHLRETEQGAAAVAVELAALGDDRGAAKAHTVHAAALARLGRFAEVEEALDRALTAAHAVGDRRLATVALAAAPVAAVWGPSPVPRAGGRCLDVVRLLRITAGSPVVEATSLRCQAVLEAFRGRIDAARGLVTSAQEMLTELGLVHDLLEADMFAAIVEIVAGDTEAADTRLRRAYHGLRQLGAEADAARAGALLARVELERGDLDEAESMAGQAEELAGDDLQAGSVWRRVQAEVLARRGHYDEARALAEAAVAIASRTDALVQHADACLGLAAVQRAAGDLAGAAQSTREATELYGRKGATALALSAQAQLSTAALSVASLPILDSKNQLTNAAADAFGRLGELFARRDWGALSSVLTDDAQTDDRRPVTRARLDRAASESYLRFMAEQGGVLFEYRVLATRGDRLALLASEVSGQVDQAAFFSAGAIDIVELARDGRITNTTLYPIGEIDLAVADLDHRYIQGEGAPFVTIFRLSTDLVRGANARDWVAVGRTLAPDVIIYDHHSGGLAERRGRHETVEAVRQVSAEQPNARWMVRAIHEPSRDVLVETIEISDGAAEVIYHNVQHRGPEGIDRVDSFGARDLDAALQAGRSLRLGAGELSNRCTETNARYWALFARRDWEAMQQLVTVDAVYDDRRPIVRTRSVGRDIEAHARQIAAHGVERISISVLATRGEHLALIKLHGESADPAVELFADESLSVIEITGDGRLHMGIGFAVEDLDGAIAELDRRYIEGEGARYATSLSIALTGSRAIDRRDWETFRACVTPDVVMQDHQWGLADARGRDALEQLSRSTMGAAEESHLIVRRIHAASDRAVAIESRLSHGAGGAYSLVHQVYRFGPAGIDRVDAFAPEALEDALATYHRMAAPGTDVLSNRFMRNWERGQEHLAAQNWDAFRALMSEDFVYEDHRSVVGVPAAGRQEVVAGMQFQIEQGADQLVVTPLAVRGSRLTLVRVSHQSSIDAENSFASVMLGVARETDDGRLDSISVYDLDDQDRAIAELDRLYIQGEGAPYAAILSSVLDGNRAISRRDWEFLRTCLAPNVVLQDHQWGMVNARGRDELERIAYQSMSTDPESRLIVRRVHIVSDRAVAVEIGLTHGVGAVLAESVFHHVFHLGPSGIDRSETFGADALDDALAVYRRLAEPTFDTPWNQCTQMFHDVYEHFVTRDWAAFTEGLLERFVYEDRRSVVSVQAVGRADAVAHMQIAAEQGADRLAFTPLAVRGANHGLVRMGTQSKADAENSFGSVMLGVVSRADGRLERTTVYDLDDLDSAMAELERQHMEGEGAPYSEILTLLAEGVRATNQRDWDGLRACFSPNVAHIEHYSAGWDSHRGRADTLAAFIQFADSLPGARSIVREIHACTTDALLATWVFSGLSRNDGAVELVFHAVCHCAGPVVDHIETFGPDRLDDALAAFRRLTAEEAPGNRCTEVFGRWAERFAARDWDGLDGLVTDDLLYLDLRPVVGLREVGRDASRRTMQILAEQGGDRVAYTVLAARGERHALLRLGVQADRDGDDSFASVMLGVVSSSPDDRFASITVFGLDDEERARVELDQQYERRANRGGHEST